MHSHDHGGCLRFHSVIARRRYTGSSATADSADCRFGDMAREREGGKEGGREGGRGGEGRGGEAQVIRLPIMMLRRYLLISQRNNAKGSV